MKEQFIALSPILLVLAGVVIAKTLAVIYQKRRDIDMRKNLVRTSMGCSSIHMKPTKWPEVMTCGHCGNKMDLISIEDGYQCRNDGCLLHFKRLEKEMA